MNKRSQGNIAENVVQNVYEERGYICCGKNYTIRGGELDLVMEWRDVRIFVEVKAINYMEDIHNFLSKRKCQALQRTIYAFNYAYPTTKNLRIDVVFVQQNRIVHMFENCVL